MPMLNYPLNSTNNVEEIGFAQAVECFDINQGCIGRDALELLLNTFDQAGKMGAVSIEIDGVTNAVSDGVVLRLIQGALIVWIDPKARIENGNTNVFASGAELVQSRCAG